MQFSLYPADTVAGNTDILTEILRRVPPKSLLRFKSVSREWRSLISSPFFASLHHHHPLLSGILLHRSSKSTLEFALLHGGPHHRPSPSSLQFAGIGDSSVVTILHSSNGLLLCSARRGPHRRSFHVYNPTTGASAAVRLPPASSTPWMNLVFDPAESPHYQLIRIDAAPSNQIHRYSSATGDWVPCRSPNFNPPFNSVLSGGVYWRGSLHWLGPTSEASLSSSLSFHLQHETFRPMPPLPRLNNDRRKRRQSVLEASGGKLLLVEAFEEGEIRVLEMQEDYSSWEVRHDHVSVISAIAEVYPQVIGRNVEGRTSKEYYKFQVCGVVEEAEEGVVVVVRVPGKVLGCGVRSKIRVWEMREVLPTTQTASDFEWIDVFPFVETLAFV